MKKLFVTMTMLAAVAVAPVFAAVNAPLRINVPYDFVVNGKTLPAGQYRITESYESSVVFVRGANAATSAMALGTTGVSHGLQQDSTLTFTVVNGQHYLVNVSHAGVSKDLRTPQSGPTSALASIKAAR